MEGGDWRLRDGRGEKKKKRINSPSSLFPVRQKKKRRRSGAGDSSTGIDESKRKKKEASPGLSHPFFSVSARKKENGEVEERSYPGGQEGRRGERGELTRSPTSAKRLDRKEEKKEAGELRPKGQEKEKARGANDCFSIIFKFSQKKGGG